MGKGETMQGMRDGMMGGMWIWSIVGALLIVFLVVAILRLLRR
jgi:uncharacterized membrane protein